MNFIISGAQTKQFQQFDLHPQNGHAVGLKTLPPSEKSAKDRFALSQKHFHQDEQKHLASALNVWVLWKSQSVISCVYLQTLGGHLFSGKTVIVKSNWFEREHICTTGDSNHHKWSEQQQCTRPHYEKRKEGTKSATSTEFSQHYKDTWRWTVSQPIHLPHI